MRKSIFVRAAEIVDNASYAYSCTMINRAIQETEGEYINMADEVRAYRALYENDASKYVTYQPDHQQSFDWLLGGFEEINSNGINGNPNFLADIKAHRIYALLLAGEVLASSRPKKARKPSSSRWTNGTPEQQHSDAPSQTTEQ